MPTNAMEVYEVVVNVTGWPCTSAGMGAEIVSAGEFTVEASVAVAFGATKNEVEVGRAAYRGVDVSAAAEVGQPTPSPENAPVVDIHTCAPGRSDVKVDGVVTTPLETPLTG